MTDTTTIKKEEYVRLKKLDKSFGALFDYFVELSEIAETRKQTKKGKTIAQKKLFKKLGL